MTKQARNYCLRKLDYAMQAAVSRSNYGDTYRQYKCGIITRRELRRAWHKATMVSARLGPPERPLHCPARTTGRNKPTRDRQLYR